MSDPGPGGAPQPPPPGWQPPPPPPPSYAGAPPPGAPPGYPPGYSPTYPPSPGQPAAGGWAHLPGPPAPGMLGAAHKPGAMPLRPLKLGDIYDAAFRIIRFNPKATVGSAVLVSALAMVLPLAGAAVLVFAAGATLDGTGDASGDTTAIIGFVVSLGLGAVLGAFGTILVTGMIAHVAGAAAIGRRLTLGEAWAATRGKRWRLIGLALLLGLSFFVLVAVYVMLWILVVLLSDDRIAPVVVWGVLSVPAFACLAAWFWVRVYYLPVPALMLEQVSVLGAVRRGYVLTRRQFWRTFGIAVLTLVVVGVASQVVGVPIGLISQVVVALVGAKYALVVLAVGQALSQVVTAAFVTPFTAAVTSLQYLDQRMRKEAYDVELMQQAGITGS